MKIGDNVLKHLVCELALIIWLLFLLSSSQAPHLVSLALIHLLNRPVGVSSGPLLLPAGHLLVGLCHSFLADPRSALHSGPQTHPQPSDPPASLPFP